MKTLIVWNEVPEQVRLFLIPSKDIDREFLNHLEGANEHFINEENWDKNEHLMFLSNYLFDEGGNCIKSELEVSNVLGTLPINGEYINQVCVSGIYL
jgi:hypothetical protein